MVLTLERLAEEIVKEINAGMEIKAQKEIVLKNNYNRQIGVSVRRADEFDFAAPIIYLEEEDKELARKSGIHAVTEKVLTVYEANKEDAAYIRERMADITDYDAVRKRIGIKLINAYANEEMIKGIPHIAVCDLAAIFYVSLSENTAFQAIVKVTDALMKTWDISEEELMNQALINMPETKIMSFEEIPFFIITAGAFGANVILRSGIEGEIKKRLHTEKLLLLPSSIYEWIALPFPKENINEILDLYRTMVSQVNANHVLPEERLSYNIYTMENDRLVVV